MQGSNFPEANFDFKTPETMTEEQCYDLPTFRGYSIIPKEPDKFGKCPYCAEGMQPDVDGIHSFELEVEKGLARPTSAKCWNMPEEDERFPVIISCWKPTAQELEEIQRTGECWLLITSSSMPPVSIQGFKPQMPKIDQ